MKLIQPLLFILLTMPCIAQEKIFTRGEFISVVQKYHPVARQAVLDVKIAGAEITASRGAFDPVLNAGRSQKDFDGSNYYNRQQTEIKIPAWYGIDLYAGNEELIGSRLNPDETKGSVNYIGLSVPLLQNIVLDKRRTAVKQARLYKEMTELQQQITLNDLVAEALKAYWDWWEQHSKYKLMQFALTHAEARLSMVRVAHRLGDRAAIDTLEALTQVQSFAVLKSEAYKQLFKAQLQLSIFLWKENNQLYELPPDVVPQPWDENLTLPENDLLKTAAAHPELLRYEVKLKYLQTSKLLKLQALLPEINLKYNRLGYSFSNTFKGAWLKDDYRFGLSLSVPLLRSQSRSDYQKAKFTLEQATIEQANKQANIYNKVKQSFIEWQQTTVQLNIQQAAVVNYKLLQRAEETRFSNGESSLFFINARELKTIEAMQKEIELKAKNYRAVIEAQRAAGMFAL